MDRTRLSYALASNASNAFFCDTRLQVLSIPGLITKNNAIPIEKYQTSLKKLHK